MVHPMMMSADMWDVTRDDGAVGILHKAGIDPWVIDFGSPDKVEGGMDRNLADHVVALSEAIDTVKEVTGRDVHLAGYSQGGMFAYQTAAYRRSKDLASIVAFGAPVDTLAALPMNLPAEPGRRRPRISWPITCSAASTSPAGWRAPGSRCSTRSRPRSRGWTSCASCTTARRCCRANSSVASWRPKAGSRGPGPAIAELLKQFIAHNRMMSGGFSIHGDLVTLSRHRLPGARGRRRGRRHRPAGLGARHQACRPAGRCVRIPHPRRAFRPCRRVEGRQPDLADRRAVGQVDRRRRRHARRRRADGAAARRTHRERCLVRVAGGAQHRRRDRDGVQPGPFGGRRRAWRPTSPRATLAVETVSHAAQAGAARPDQRPHPDLARPHHVRAGPRRARTASACCSTAACTPTKRSTAASTTSSAA